MYLSLDLLFVYVSCVLFDTSFLRIAHLESLNLVLLVGFFFS